ncbi:MAG: hypothetical protein WAQ53_13585 [Thiofilum sp.]|uniref:hypothetical protein n=1 Tax=Thiofilum sp. TaxID=2212733 RepID=UPI0025CE7D03|nr:hypothetical protein [Thiofilum sp.]MBK8453611.1 hypothetical protein [Thiofilum sp.]
MITRQFVNEINELKHELLMLQSLSQLVHDNIKLVAACETEPSVLVGQDVANRLWKAFQTLETLENRLETYLESRVEVAA